MDSVLGSDRRSRGVWQRAEAEGALIPPYPAGSRRRGEEGLVIVVADIDAGGRCLAADIEKSSGFAELDAAALDTIRLAPFQPARLDGAPRPARERFVFEFQLR
jgi:protein TonB